LFYVGTSNISGNLTLNNNNGRTYVCYYSSSSVTISGTTSINNTGTATYSLVYLGYYGDITFNNTVTIKNSSSASSSGIYVAYSNSCSLNFNENVSIECTNASADGVIFGSGGGTTSLATGKTLSIGAGGFVAGDLDIRNFVQNDTTSHTFTLTGTAKFKLYETEWKGNLEVSAPSIISENSIFKGTVKFEKTGNINVYYNGGNIYYKDAEFINSGSNDFYICNSKADTFELNLTLKNQGGSSSGMSFANYGALVKGDLNVSNTGKDIYISYLSGHTLKVLGDVVLDNTSSENYSNIYFVYSGTAEVSGDLTATNNPSGTEGYITVCTGSATFNGTSTF
jgi:hypothetical protein